MDDLLARVQEILGSEEGREQLQSIAQMFGAGDGNAPELPDLGKLLGKSEPPAPAEAVQKTEQPADLGIDVGMLMQVQKILGSLGQEDKNTRLLLALKPHFGEERQQKVDQAVRMLRLLSVLPMLRQSGLLGGLFDDGGK